MARAFEARGWPTSAATSRPFDPGYGDSWPIFQGAVGTTFEAAGPIGLAYQRQDGEILTLESHLQRSRSLPPRAEGFSHWLVPRQAPGTATW